MKAAIERRERGKRWKEGVEGVRGGEKNGRGHEVDKGEIYCERGDILRGKSQ